MSIAPGDIAPEFTLPNTVNEKVSLSNFKNKKNVVLLFFPLAFSSVCTAELCHTRDDLSEYESLDAEILAISVDSHYTLREFKKSNNLNFTLLSDFNKNISELYGALYDNFYNMLGVSKRAAFVIDKKGVVRYSEVLDNAGDLPDFNKIHASLDGI